MTPRSPYAIRNSQLNVYAADPTLTTPLRRDYAAAMSRRFDTLRLLIEAAIAAGFFGSGEEILLELGAIELFAGYLQEEVEAVILEIGDDGPSYWQLSFVSAAVMRGVSHADKLLALLGFAPRPTASGGVSLFQPLITRLSGYNYELLTAATDDMVAAVRAALVEGVGQRLTLDDIAARIVDRVDHVGLYRARMIARTEIVRAHAEGTLDRYEGYGVGAASALVEWDDGGHCPICTALQQRDNGYGPGVYSISQARGLIPVHPNCTCAWIPVPPAALPMQNLHHNSRAGLVAAVIAALRQRSRVLDWLLGGGDE